MADFVALESRMAAALERISTLVEDVHPKAELFSSTRSTSQDLERAQMQIKAMQSEMDARDGALAGLLKDVDVLSQDLADGNTAIGVLTDERDQLADEVQRLVSDNAKLTAERDHLRTQPIPSGTDEGQKHQQNLAVALQTVATFEAEHSKLKAMNVALVKTSKELRNACEKNQVDADMVDRNLKASLDALEANQSSDSAELSALKAILKPILEEAQNA